MSYHCPMCDWKDPSKQPVCPKCGHPTVEDEKNPRAWTQKEVQDKFLHHCWAMVKYWDQDSRKPDPRGKLEGLMHSFLTLLDGCAMGFPAKLHVEWNRSAGRPTIDVGSRLSVHLFPREGHWLWGLVKDWYDGPHYLFGVGPLVLIAWW